MSDHYTAALLAIRRAKLELQTAEREIADAIIRDADRHATHCYCPPPHDATACTLDEPPSREP